jgi:hypothetical protein
MVVPAGSLQDLDGVLMCNAPKSNFDQFGRVISNYPNTTYLVANWGIAHLSIIRVNA